MAQINRATLCVIMPPPPWGRGSKHCFCSSIGPFVCPSVCPSVSHIASNSRTPRPNVPKFGRKVPYLRCDSHTSFKVKRSKAGSQGTYADTHRAPYLPNSKAYELQTWYTDGGRRPASATGAMTSKVKGRGRKITWSVWALSWPNALPVSLESGGGIPCRPNPAATLLVINGQWLHCKLVNLACISREIDLDTKTSGEAFGFTTLS